MRQARNGIQRQDRFGVAGQLWRDSLGQGPAGSGNPRQQRLGSVRLVRARLAWPRLGTAGVHGRNATAGQGAVWLATSRQVRWGVPSLGVRWYGTVCLGRIGSERSVMDRPVQSRPVNARQSRCGKQGLGVSGPGTPRFGQSRQGRRDMVSLGPAWPGSTWHRSIGPDRLDLTGLAVPRHDTARQARSGRVCQPSAGRNQMRQVTARPPRPGSSGSGGARSASTRHGMTWQSSLGTTRQGPGASCTDTAGTAQLSNTHTQTERQAHA